ncbi:MAG: phosphotransferase, partial [Longimicrobiales bacterium]
MTRCSALLPHPLEPRLLMLNSHGEWRLPGWEDSAAHAWQETDHVNRAVAARFGVETTVLRCVHSRIDPATDEISRVYELENHSAPHDMIPSTTWIGQAELPMLHVPDPEVRELAHAWFSRRSGEATVRGAAWSHPGWYIEALAWAVARLSDIGVMATRTPVQLRASERAFVMRIRSRTETFYFRAVPFMFAHEPAVMQWLARKHPLNVPQIIAVDDERGWMLQREAGDGALPLSEEREEEVWFRAARRMAEIQIDSSHDGPVLRSLGCPDRDLDVLARRLPRLCEDTSVMMLGHPCGLRRRSIERVAALTPTLLALCDELASFRLPDCVDYGDLRAANIYSTTGEPVYLDWSDSSISHPFFAISNLIADAVRLLPSTSREAQRHLRDS